MELESLVSIITPFYNAEKFISDAVSSVLKQTHENWELLLINDGSTDKSKHIVLNFNDSRIRYFEQRNQGVSAARNQGLEEMRGDFFCFLDADDRLPVNSLIDRLRLFKDTDVFFVDGHVLSYDQGMKQLEYEFVPSYSGNPFNELVRLSPSCFFGITWMIRKEKNVKYQFPLKMKYAEDLWFFTQLAYKGGIYKYVDSPVYERRSVENSAMSNIHGLAKGYWVYYSMLMDNGQLTKRQARYLKKRIRSILFKLGIKKVDPGMIKYILSYPG